LPQDEESKMVEFDMAEFGITNLQTFASQLVLLSKSVDMEDLIAKVTVTPRQILKMEVPIIEEDSKANLTLFDPSAEWTFDASQNFSKSKNSPWLGQTLKGKAVAVFNNGKMKMEEESLPCLFCKTLSQKSHFAMAPLRVYLALPSYWHFMPLVSTPCCFNCFLIFGLFCLVCFCR
jgi:hypothetical protein